jgi:hypothetical protein
MTDKKFTLHVIAYGAPKFDTGFVPHFAVSDPEGKPWVLEEFKDGSKKAVSYVDGLHLSEQIAWYMGELDAAHITSELLDMEQTMTEKEKLGAENVQQIVHENTERMANRFGNFAKDFEMPKVGFTTPGIQDLVDKAWPPKDGAAADTLWWISMLAKEAKYKFGPKARSYARMSRMLVKHGAKSAKERVERFDEDHPEAASWAIMGGSTLLSIGYLWWAKWYSDRWMEKLAKTIKEAS